MQETEHKYRLRETSKFKKELKKALKKGFDESLIIDVVEMLLCGIRLPDKYRDHSLKGNLKGYRECHILPDWLLIYKIEEEILVLTLSRTGSHSDLFISEEKQLYAIQIHN